MIFCSRTCVVHARPLRVRLIRGWFHQTIFSMYWDADSYIIIIPGHLEIDCGQLNVVVLAPPYTGM